MSLLDRPALWELTDQPCFPLLAGVLDCLGSMRAALLIMPFRRKSYLPALCVSTYCTHTLQYMCLYVLRGISPVASPRLVRTIQRPLVDRADHQLAISLHLVVRPSSPSKDHQPRRRDLFRPHLEYCYR